jgi:hypothetical protein
LGSAARVSGVGTRFAITIQHKVDGRQNRPALKEQKEKK